MNPLEVLRALGPGSAPPRGAEARVYERVLGALTPLGIDQKPSSGAVANGSAELARRAIWRSKPASMLVAWLIGGGMGAAIYGLVRPAAVRFVQAPPTPSAHALVPATDPSLSPSLPAASIAAPGSSSAQPSDRAALARGVAPLPIRASNASILKRERALLDVARAKAAQGEPLQVLEQADSHLRQFPTGRLAEEREALAIRALLNLGRTSEARVRARAFQARYPNSLLSSAAESALLP